MKWLKTFEQIQRKNMIGFEDVHDTLKKNPFPSNKQSENFLQVDNKKDHADVSFSTNNHSFKVRSKASKIYFESFM